MGPNPSHKTKVCLKRKIPFFLLLLQLFSLKISCFKNILLGSYADGCHFASVTEQGEYVLENIKSYKKIDNLQDFPFEISTRF